MYLLTFSLSIDEDTHIDQYVLFDCKYSAYSAYEELKTDEDFVCGAVSKILMASEERWETESPVTHSVNPVYLH